MSPEEIMILNNLEKSISKLFEYREEDRKIATQILQQTTRTNGRVTALEKGHDECPIKEIQRETEVTRIFTKNPKILRFVIIGAFVINIGLLSTVVVSINKINTITEQFNQYKQEHKNEDS